MLVILINFFNTTYDTWNSVKNLPVYVQEQYTNAKQRPKPTIQSPPTKKQMVTSQKELLNIACDYLKNHDEYENLGLAWVNEIKKMKVDQLIRSKKAIHDIICTKASWIRLSM